jgi:hypothetical protein
MANASRRFGLFNFAIFTAAAVTVLAVAALAYRPDLDSGTIALSIGTPTPMLEASRERQGAPVASDQLAVFLQRWASTTQNEQ